MKKLLLIVLLSILTTPIYSAQNWYDNLVFTDKNCSFQLARIMGYTYYGGADIGEILQTARSIKDCDVQSWYQQWLKTANRIYRTAQSFAKYGDIISARNAYFRASNYYRAAGFYMDAKQNRAKSIYAWQLGKKNFLQAIASIPYIKPIKIPYENTTLPGYFIKSRKPNAPLLIVNTGFDGTVEELYFDVGIAAHKRGFNVLLYEGPGQGGVLRKQKLPFRYDWEKVVTPVVDFALKIPGIDKNKIALMGISMGGYLAPRACAFEHRIKACIVNGGVYDFAANLYNSIPAEVTKQITTNPKQFNRIIYKIMQENFEIRWFFNHGMWAFDANSPAKFMQKLNKYNLKNSARNIKCPTLILDSEADTFLHGQAKQLYRAIHAPKKYYLFTKKQAAQAHCQMGAKAISNAIILNWLMKVFDWK